MRLKKYPFVYTRHETDRNIRGKYIYRNTDGGYNYRSEHGRSSAVIDCPFCNTPTRCFIWSLAGGGKKCDCGAILSGRFALIEIRRIKEQENVPPPEETIKNR